jgi:hypothetical protein
MKRYLIISIFFILTLGVYAQEDDGVKNITLNGYIKYMNTIQFMEFDEGWATESMFHNRLNFRWYMSDAFTSGIEMRNRFIYGDYVESVFWDYEEYVAEDNGYLNELTQTHSGASYILTSTVDRLWMNYHTSKLDITLGRQRINWSQSFVWNPNDIFNTYSFFDFDYEEKPGSDALRVQYYPGFTSTAELAVKVDAEERITVAGLYRFNQWGYDFQFLGGILNDEDYVAGTGWSGNIKDAGFGGEMTYIHPEENFSDTTGKLLASVNLNYMFNNSLYIQGELFYNEFADQMNFGGFNTFMRQELSVKTLSFSKWSWFLQASYPIHPLLDGTLALMYYPDLDGYFVNPSLKYSLSDNIQLSAYGQIFTGEFMQNMEETINFLFFRFKWSF